MSDWWQRAIDVLKAQKPNAKLATIIECDREYAWSPHRDQWFEPGWGYRDETTGNIVSGWNSEGEVWDETQAELAATDAGYWIRFERTP